MKILLISTHWPSNQRSGVSLAAAQHAQILIGAGYSVSIVGSHPAILNEAIGAKKKYFVRSCGSAALYSKTQVDRVALESAIRDADPDLIIIESWQTALSDLAVTMGSQLGFKILMISHGVSVHPLSWLPRDIGRSIAWLHYLFFLLPRLIAKLSLLTSLSLTSQSRRFYDRDLARRLGVPVMPLFNQAVHIAPQYIQREGRKLQILVVGYFSYIKNQLAVLRIAKDLVSQIRFKFIGEKSGKYYERCLQYVHSNGMQDSVTFQDDRECNVAEEMAASLLVVSTSLTEALPITLLEAMSAGTPFIASNVGAVDHLRGGIAITGGKQAYKLAILGLLSDAQLWQRYSDDGRACYNMFYSDSKVKEQLLLSVRAALAGHASLEYK